MSDWKRIEPGYYRQGNLAIRSELPFQNHSKTVKWYLRENGHFIQAFTTLIAAKNYVTTEGQR